MENREACLNGHGLMEPVTYKEEYASLCKSEEESFEKVSALSKRCLELENLRNKDASFVTQLCLEIDQLKRDIKKCKKILQHTPGMKESCKTCGGDKWVLQDDGKGPGPCPDCMSEIMSNEDQNKLNDEINRKIKKGDH